MFWGCHPNLRKIKACFEKKNRQKGTSTYRQITHNPDLSCWRLCKKRLYFKITIFSKNVSFGWQDWHTGSPTAKPTGLTLVKLESSQKHCKYSLHRTHSNRNYCSGGLCFSHHNLVPIINKLEHRSKVLLTWHEPCLIHLSSATLTYCIMFYGL